MIDLRSCDNKRHATVGVVLSDGLLISLYSTSSMVKKSQNNLPGAPKLHPVSEMPGRTFKRTTRTKPKPAAQQVTTSNAYAKYVTNANLGSAIRYALAILGMVTPSLLRDVAGRNIAALQQNHYEQVLLPDINDVHQTLLHRDAKRS